MPDTKGIQVSRIRCQVYMFLVGITAKECSLNRGDTPYFTAEPIDGSKPWYILA